MNLITIIFVIVIILGASDLLTEPFPKLQKGIFHISFFLTFFLFTIKYYYGPDIWNYVHHYENIPVLHEVIAHPDELMFEQGWNIFCSILKHAGVSFYWMTVIVSVIYFGVVYVFLSRIKRKQSFALMILVLLDFILIFATYRQCLSVACFLLMVSCLQRKEYIIAFVLAIVSASMHKSGIFVVSLTLFYYAIRSRQMQPYVYQLLFFALLLVALLPIVNISNAFISALPIPDSYTTSIKHHLSLGKQIQTVWAMYALTILALAHYTQYRKSRLTTFAAVTIVALVLVVSFYQYYYLLSRLRSYFIVIVLVYVFKVIQDAEDEGIRIPYASLTKQILCVGILAYFVHFSVTFTRNANKLHNNVYKACTVFDLMGDVSKKDLQQRQLKLAYRYWKEDFMKDNSNKVLHD